MIIHFHPSENTEFLSTWKPSVRALRANWIPLRSQRIYYLWWIPATCFVLFQTDMETFLQTMLMLIIFDFIDCHWQIPATCFVLFPATLQPNFKLNICNCHWPVRLSLSVAPVIVTPPGEVYNVSGSQVYLSCEAVGVPTPVLTWKRVRHSAATLKWGFFS